MVGRLHRNSLYRETVNLELGPNKYRNYEQITWTGSPDFHVTHPCCTDTFFSLVIGFMRDFLYPTNRGERRQKFLSRLTPTTHIYLPCLPTVLPPEAPEFRKCLSGSQIGQHNVWPLPSCTAAILELCQKWTSGLAVKGNPHPLPIGRTEGSSSDHSIWKEWP